MGNSLIKDKGDATLVAVLLLLNFVPVAASVLRLYALADPGAASPENARFIAAPFVTVVHLLSSGVFGVAGIGQFLPGLRQRYPAWHRRAGWALAVGGLVSAVSGLWMTAFFPRVPGDSDFLDVLRLFFGTAMVLCLLTGLRAARARDFIAHRAWMIRGYALGMGAGTQVAVHIPWLLVAGTPEPLTRAVLLGAGWAINLAIAEWFIARGRRRPAPPKPTRHPASAR